MSAGLLSGLAISSPFVSPASAAPGIATHIHGVNWADPRDNFQSGNIVPSSLSANDSYATTYAKATAIARGFQSFGTNTIRFGINESTVAGSWWNSYTAAFDATAALGMNVMISPWPPPGGPNRVTNTAAFYAMWDRVINKYQGNSRFYFDIYNEPSGYSTAALIDFCAAWLARYPNIPRDHVVVPGTGNDADVTQVGASPRLSGTLLGLHMYSVYGLSHLTQAGWAAYIRSKVGPYGNRVVFSEFKVATTNGVNYNGPRDGNNHVSYLYAITDTARELGMGTLIWPGLMTGNAYSVTRVSGSGSNLTVSVNNQTVIDRLRVAWDNGGTTPPFTPPVTTRPPTTPPTRPPTTPPTAPPTTRPPTGNGCTGVFTVQNSWAGGFVGAVRVSAPSGASSWRVTLSLPSGTSITNTWNGALSGSTVSNASWNGSIPAGGSTEFGFQGAGSASGLTVTGCTTG